MKRIQNDVHIVCTICHPHLFMRHCLAYKDARNEWRIQHRGECGRNHPCSPRLLRVEPPIKCHQEVIGGSWSYQFILTTYNIKIQNGGLIDETDSQ